MSIVSNNKKTLDKRTPLKEVPEAPLRDQIVKKLFVKAKELELGSKVVKAWHVESANLTEMLEKQQQYVVDLDEHLPSSAEGEFAGTSNLKIPMPHIVSKAYIARFFQALWSVDPPFTVKSRREDGTEKVALIEDFMRYTIYSWANHYKGVDEAVETWLSNWVNSGTGIMKTRWSQEYCSFVDAVKEPRQGPPRFAIDGKGKEVAIPTIVEEEVERTITIPKFAGPVVETVQLEDFIMVGGAGDPDLADMVIHRYYLTESELWGFVDEGKFDEEAVEETIRAGASRITSGLNNSIKTQRSELTGKASLETATALDRYEILETYMKACVDDSGIDSDLIVWVSAINGEILRSTYLYRVIPTGQRPFSVIHFHKRPGQEYGTGLLEILHPLSVELDALHNIKLDHGMITANPIFFYRSSSSFQPEKLQVEPGMGIPLDNPQTDVVFPQRPQSTGFFGNEEQLIQVYIERLTGISDLSLGAMGGQGAARTATGARALLSESNTNLDIHLRHLMRGWKKLLSLLFHMLQQRVDGDFVFRITGQDGSDVFRKIGSYDLALDVDFEIAPNSANSNKAIQLENAQQLVAITSNPLYLQLGVTGPGQVYEALKSMLNAMGIKDVHRFVSKPQGYTYAPSPEEVFNRVVRGQQIKPSPSMDVDGIIAFMQSMLDSQSKSQVLSEEQIRNLISGMRQFQQMKQALDSQQQQVAVASQMQANAALSQQQAPVGLNPLAGSENAGGLPVG